MGGKEQKPPGSVLFVCTMNAVRSPMAAALMHNRFGNKVFVDSAGVDVGAPDGFAIAVMREIGIDLTRHQPRALEDLDEAMEGSFDLIVCLSAEAHRRALDLCHSFATEVEHWPTPDVTTTEGSREERLAAYRELRAVIDAQIRDRFG